MLSCEGTLPRRAAAHSLKKTLRLFRAGIFEEAVGSQASTAPLDIDVAYKQCSAVLDFAAAAATLPTVGLHMSANDPHCITDFVLLMEKKFLVAACVFKLDPHQAISVARLCELLPCCSP